MSDASGGAAPGTSGGPSPECAAVLDFSAVHGVIRGYVGKFEAAVAQVGSDRQRATAVAGLVLFGVAGLRFHHHEEDAEYWPALIAKGADEAELEPLAAEHRELDSMLDELEQRARKLKGAPEAAAAVAELIGPLRDHVLGHLDEEEPIMFPMLRRYISDDEARTMAKRAARQAPREGLPWLIGGIAYAMNPDERRAFMTAFPKPIVWLTPLLLRRYRRQCAVIGITPEFA